MRNLLIAEKIMNRKNWLANKPRPVSPFLLLDRSVQERQAQAEANLQWQAVQDFFQLQRAMENIQREMIINGEAFVYNGDIIRNE